MSNAFGRTFAAVILAITWLSPACAQQSADAARWGIYASLLGTAQEGGNGLRVQWRWETPGESLAEEYLLPQSGRTLFVNTVTLGPQPGTLVATDRSNGRVWDGTLQPDGSISFVARSGQNRSYRALIASGGAFEMRRTKVEGGIIVSEKEARSAERFAPTGGANPQRMAQAEERARAQPIARPTTSAPSVAPPAEAAAPVAAPARDFGFLERYVGQLLVSDRHTLEIYREGNGLALHLGDAGGSRTRRWVVSLDGATGTYELSETTYPTPLESRRAYFDANGDLYLEYEGENYRHMTRFRAVDGAVIRQTRSAERRRFGRYGPFDEWDASRFVPATQDALRSAAINNAYARQDELRRQEEARELKRERDQQWMNNMNALNQGLQNALADASASEQQSRAELDATLQRAAEQAANERELAAQREQQQANARAADDLRRAREATERQYEIARQYEAQQQAQRLAQTQAQQGAPPATASRPATPTALPSATAANSGSAASCPKVYKSGTGNGYADSQADAERWTRRDMELQCPMARYSAGAMRCSQKNQGDIVNVDSKGRSTKVGERLAWYCEADFRCSEPSDQCAKGPAKGSAQ